MRDNMWRQAVKHRPMKNNLFSIVVLIATCNRPHLLRTRSLPSVNCQILQPSIVIMVDDSDENFYEINQSVFYEFIPANWNPVYLKNARTKGNAGAWNTGLDWIGKQNSNAWIAILDDDDTWEPQHLNNCVNAIEQHIDGVVSRIQTIINGKCFPIKTEKRFTVSDFLRGNPGWEGSNTFLKYSTFKKVGFFDEKLSCTHDRDLAIRLLSDPLFRLRILDQITVKHYIESDRESLTNGPKKKIGMIQFWRKHSWRMSDNDKTAFLERAEKLFHLPNELFG